MKKGIILARVSTPEQQKQGLSIEEIQLPQLRQYAADHDIEVPPELEFVFQETASGKLRKKFDEMVAFVKSSPEITEIIAFRVDRMTRNYRDAVEMDTLRTEYGKQLHFVSDRLVLSKKIVGRDIQDWDMKVFLAKQHINRCQEDSYNTIQSKLRNNEIYAMAPYGYENYRDEAGRSGVRIKNPAAQVVREIFNLYSTGVYSYLAIANKIKADLAVELYKGKVEKIIKNPFYVGYREYDGKTYPHKYPPLITQEIWDKVQQIRNGRWQGQRKAKFVGKNGLFRGLLYCSECGCSMTPETHKKTQKNGNKHSWVYYHCTGAKGKHKGEWVEEKDLTEQFLSIFRHMQIPEVELQKMIRLLKESHAGKVEYNEDLFNDYTSQIQRLEKRMGQIYLDKLDGVIDQKQFENLRNTFRKEQQEYEAKIQQLGKADEEYYTTASALLEVASRSEIIFRGSEPELKREIIGLTLQNLSWKSGKLSYELQKPFDIIYQTSGSLNWGG